MNNSSKIVRQLHLLRHETATELNRIDDAIAAITSSIRKRRLLSADARARISAAQKKRWAKVRKAA
jgi:hypothetical protein